MKYLNYCFLLIFSLVIFGCATTKSEHKHKASTTVFEKEVNGNTKISTEMRINDLNRVHAHVYLKTPRKNGSCSGQTSMRSRSCRVKTIEVPVKGIELVGNNVFFTSNGTKTKCGIVKNKGVRGRSVVLDKSCNLESEIVYKSIDDGVNITKTRFGLVTFNIEM